MVRGATMKTSDDDFKLLPKINGKTLIVKDFCIIAEGQWDAMTLRDIYDQERSRIITDRNYVIPNFMIMVNGVPYEPRHSKNVVAVQQVAESWLSGVGSCYVYPNLEMMMKTKVRQARRIPQNAKTRLRIVKAFVGFCMAELMSEGMCNGDFKEASNRTQLCIATLRRLKKGNISTKIWSDTMIKLGTAIDAKVQWGEAS